MAKRITRYILIVLGLVTLWVSTSSGTMEHIWSERRGRQWWQSDYWRNGNLVGMSHLELVKKSLSPEEHNAGKAANHDDSSKVVLYICGDSYSWSLKDTNFCGISAYHFINRYTGGGYRLDPAKNNILIIEASDRPARTYFKETKIIDEVYDSARRKQTVSTPMLPINRSCTKYAAFPFHLNSGILFNKNINQNIERLLFNFNFFMPVFQAKGALNYFCFNRASGDVVISRDGSFLLDKGCVADTATGNQSHVSAGEISNIVSNLNKIDAHYKASGFKEVYLSLIPNTAAIIDTAGYNRLIPLIQHDPRLKMKVIDVYSVLYGHGAKYFRRGDTHWNRYGEEKWLEQVNNMLIHQSKQQNG